MLVSRRIAIAIGLLISAMVLAGVIAYIKAQSNPTVVRIGITPFQDTVLPVVPEKLGWYEKDGYRVQFVNVGWTDVPLGLASGSFDVVLYSSDSFLPAWPALTAGGKDVVFYAPLYAFNGAAIMVHGNAGYQTLSSIAGLTRAQVDEKTRSVMSQLRGKRIGITEGTIAEQVVREALAKAGLSSSDVELINARYEDNLAAFLAGQLDAFVGGVTERVKARQAGAVELIVGAAISDPPIDGWITSKAFADKHPEIMQSLVNNFYRTVDYMDADLVGRAHLVTDYLKGKASVNYTPEEYAYAWSFQYFPRSRQEASEAFLNSSSLYYWKRVWQHTNEFLVKTGKITEPVPYEVFWGEKTLPPK